MTVFFPDLSHYNSGTSLKGAPAVIAKATQGSSYIDPVYDVFRVGAQAQHIPFCAYHWLDTTAATAQAKHCYSVVGPHVPLMIDDEQQRIVVEHTLEFVAAYRALGGRVILEYAPHWVWANSGRPNLIPLARAGLGIVSSSYPAYSDNGPGWGPYGGVSPLIWQYADNQSFNGRKVDFNAYRGSLAQLTALFAGPTIGDDMPLTKADAELVYQNNWHRELRSDPPAGSAPLSAATVLLDIAETVDKLAAAPPAPPPVDLSDAQLDTLADKVAARLHALTFTAAPPPTS